MFIEFKKFRDYAWSTEQLSVKELCLTGIDGII